MLEGTEKQIEEAASMENDGSDKNPMSQIQSMECPLRLLNDHWLTISRPQYKRTCGISSLVSIWNFQFSRLGLGTREPINVQQAMLKLNLIGKGSLEEDMRKRFKKANQLTEKPQENNEIIDKCQVDYSQKSLKEYIDSVDFGCFTGNETLLKWYRLLCRLYGGCGRSYFFYKQNANRSLHKNEKSAKKGLVEGLSSGGKICFIYHAYDHYFCPVGYEFIPVKPSKEMFDSATVNQEGSELYVMVGESSKMFAPLHVFKWSQIQLDLNTFWPHFYNIRRRKQGVQLREGKQNSIPHTSSINCIMAFEKIKD